MKDKVAEFRKMLDQKKTAAEKILRPALPQDKISPVPPEPVAGSAPEVKQLPPTDTSAMEKKINELEDKILTMQGEHKAQYDLFLRKAADLENSKKRLEKESAEQMKFAGEKIISDILPIVDNLEMTLSHAQENDPIAAGVKLIHKSLLQSLEKFGVTAITGLGEMFNPHQQEAIGAEPHSKYPPGTVIAVHRKGYLLHSKVIRAALVTVCKN